MAGSEVFESGINVFSAYKNIHLESNFAILRQLDPKLYVETYFWRPSYKMADISVNKPDLKMSQAEMDSTGKITLETVLKSLVATRIKKLSYLPCLG